MSSQTIGVEFASKIIRLGTGPRRKRIKFQLWDTAGTERFRAVSRSYYRGAAGAILVYDIASSASFEALPTFLMDARALASPNLTVLLAGNKSDLTTADGSITANGRPGGQYDPSYITHQPSYPPSSSDSKHLKSESISQQEPSVDNPSTSFPLQSNFPSTTDPAATTTTTLAGARQTATIAPEGREVAPETATRWASKSQIPLAIEVSALSGDKVDELFTRLARMILTKIELGEIDPDDPQSGIHYGDADAYAWARDAGGRGGGSIRSIDDDDDDDEDGDGNVAVSLRRRRGAPRRNNRGWMGDGNRSGGSKRWTTGANLSEWGDVFRLPLSSNRRRRGSGGGACQC